MKIDKLLAANMFIFLWVLSGLTLWILPVESRFDNTLEMFILTVFFVMIVYVVGILWYQSTPLFRIKLIPSSRIHGYTKRMPYAKLVYIIKLSGMFTIIGNAMVLFDRIFIRHINFSLGLRNARYQWLASGGSGSLISIIGNLLIPFSYAALFMGVFHWERIKRKEKVYALVTGFGGQIFLALMNGGRSNILSALFFSFTVCVIRKYYGKNFLPPIRGKFILIGFAIVILLRYVSSILYAFTDNNLAYLQVTVNGLGGRLDSSYNSNPFMNTVIEICMYILHGTYYTGAAIKYHSGIADLNHNMSLRGINVLIGRLPFVNYHMELPEFDGGGGNFVALPGILLYDYGYIGFVIGALAFGILLGSVLKHLNNCNKNLSNAQLIFCIAVLMHVYMSMIDMALGFGYFIFMIFGMIAAEYIAAKKYGKTGWTDICSD